MAGDARRPARGIVKAARAGDLPGVEAIIAICRGSRNNDEINAAKRPMRLDRPFAEGRSPERVGALVEWMAWKERWVAGGDRRGRACEGRTAMRHVMPRFGRSGWAVILALAILLVSARTASAQFPAYGGGGMAFGYPGWGYGGFYGYPAIGYGYGYGGIGYGSGAVGYGYPGPAYGFPAWGGNFYGGYGYPAYYGFGYGNPGFYTPGLLNPLFGVGMTPLGAQSYMLETRVFGRRRAR
jgi:hypothetical protein